METPSAVTINVNNKLTPPAPTAAPSPASSTATNPPTSNPPTASYLPIISPSSTSPIPSIDELKAQYGEEPVAALIDAGFTNPAEVRNLLKIIATATGSKEHADEAYKELPGALLIIAGAGLTDPDDIRAFLIDLCAATGQGLDNALRWLDKAVISLQKAGYSSPGEIINFIESIAVITDLNAGHIFANLDMILEAFTAVGFNDREDILNILVALDKFGNLTDDLMEDALPSLMSDLHNEYGFSSSDIRQLVMGLIAQANSAYGLFLTLGKVSDIIRTLEEAGIASHSQQLALLTNSGDHLLDLPVLLNIINGEKFSNPQALFGRLQLLSGIILPAGPDRKAMEAVYQALPEAISTLKELGIYSPEDIYAFLNAFVPAVAPSIVSALEELPDALKLLSKRGVDDPTRNLALLLEMAETAGASATSLFDDLRYVLDLCKELGLDIYNLSPGQKEIIFDINPERFSHDHLGGWIEGAYRKIILNRLQALDPSYRDERPLAIVIFPEYDNNGAFTKDKKIIDQLIAQGYRVLYYEAENENEFIDSFLAGTQSQDASVVLIGGHGEIDNTQLGNPNRSYGYQAAEELALDLNDEAQLKAAGLSSRVTSNASIISVSCSTGEGTENANNMANMWRRIFPGRHIFAPTIPANVDDLDFDDDHHLTDVDWTDKSAAYKTSSLPPLELNQ